jgi:hypothetical protein
MMQSHPSFIGILWIDASSMDSISRSFETVARKMVSSGRSFGNADESGFICQGGTCWVTKPCLMVFDNFDDPDSCQGIRTFLPQSRNGVILFTSRHTVTAELHVGLVIKMSGMTETQGMQLLAPNLSSPDNNMMGKKILDALGYLPLAIDQAHAYIQAKELPLSHFMHHYQRRKKQILELTPAFSQYQKQSDANQAAKALSVFTTWELSFEQLGKTCDSLSLQKFLMLCGFFYHGHIKEDLFETCITAGKRLSPVLNIFVAEGS